MKKMKFKIEYVPLSDSQIERHKDFEGLMAAFALHPKPTFKERIKSKLFGNKFSIYMGGIITGAIVTSAIWWGLNTYNTSEKITEQKSKANTEEVSKSVASESSEKNQPNANKEQNTESSSATSTGSESANSVTSSGKEVQAENNNAASNKETQSSEENKSSSANASTSVKTEKKSAAQSQQTKTQKKETTGGAAVVTSKKASSNKNNSASNGKAKSSGKSDFNYSNQNSGDAASNQNQNAKEQSGHFQEEQISSLNLKSDTLTLNSEFIPAEVHEPSLLSLNEDSSKKKIQLNLPKIDFSDEWKSTKSAVVKFTDTVGSKTSGFLTKLFTKDTSNIETQTVHIDSIPQKNVTTSSRDTFKHRFAQVTFVTPLGSDGINGKDYVHNLSFNVLQGYSGALNGFELGGLANVEKGYVKGFQLAGLSNFAFGDIEGFQLAGLVNSGKNLSGFQLGGLVNSATGTMKGMQLGGVVNYVGDTMKGVQLGGVLNLSASNAPSTTCWQFAGVTNIALGNTSGGQAAGVFNGARDHHGVQVGLINFAKKISGAQIGLINIADTIDGESVGLINISRNGIHNVDVFGSEVLFANVGLRLGSPHVYTLFAAGIRPFSDITRMGFGLGIGGHIPIKESAFMKIDGICWTIHNDNLKDWNNVNLWNQIRFMGGYQITKGMAIYAGPTLNLQVYDLSYPSVAPYTIYTHRSGTTQLDGWIGGVIGLQFF